MMFNKSLQATPMDREQALDGRFLRRRGYGGQVSFPTGVGLHTFWSRVPELALGS